MLHLTETVYIFRKFTFFISALLVSWVKGHSHIQQRAVTSFDLILGFYKMCMCPGLRPVKETSKNMTKKIIVIKMMLSMNHLTSVWSGIE